MKKLIFLTAISILLFQSCDLIDGTGVENPDLPLDEAVNQANSATPWVNGLNEQTASVYNAFLVTAELSTDNYVNIETFFNQNVDVGTYRYTDGDFDDTQTALSALLEQSKFGLNTVLKNDENAAGSNLEAEMHFHKGLAHLLIGELTTAYPAVPVGDALTPAAHFDSAATSFDNALAIDDQNVSYHLGLARAYYNLGNQSAAVSAAEDAIAENPDNDYVRFVNFDGVDGPANTMQNAVYDRGNFDDLQPLPRLDFLDPKYAQDGNTESQIPLFKIEEAHLILAEADLADDNLLGAQGHMSDVVSLANNTTKRPTRDFDEAAEGRAADNASATSRPDSAAYEVLFSPDDNTPKSGYVLNRTASTTVPTISGTNVTDSDINNTINLTEATELLYLLWQEIFFGEGRRIFDLGIRWPVNETEYLNNSNIEESDIEAIIPDDLPSGQEMDGFTIDGFEVTMNVNLNTIIAQRGTRFD